MTPDTRPTPSWARVCARVRLPLTALGGALLLATAVTDVTPLPRVPWLGPAALVTFVVGFALYLRVGRLYRAPVEVASPVSGWWRVLNSPADRVPSHGLHAYGQTYAVDLVYDPGDGSRPGFGWRPVTRRPEEFPAFGRPVHAMASGTVARTHHRERDHRSRTSWLGMLYLLLEGVREIGGPGRVLGNHVVVDQGDGVYAAYAHLRRGSLRVRPGDRVAAGDVLAECGNSGNSTEPHLHVQLMDHPRVGLAGGLPFRLAAYETEDGARTDGVPANGTRVRGLTAAETVDGGTAGERR